MAKPATLKSCKELEQLLNGYTEQIEKLCRLYDVQPKRNKDQKKRIKAAAKELRELLVETEDRSFDVSSILGIIESGTEMIKKTIGELEIDSDVVQPCRVSSMHRVLGDTQKKMISSGAVKHNHKMMRFMKDLKTKQKPFPAIQELFQEETSYKLRTAYNKMGIDTKGFDPEFVERVHMNV